MPSNLAVNDELKSSQIYRGEKQKYYSMESCQDNIE